jgi:hypothetical protein
MNERIKALAEQAGEYAAQNATGDWEVGPNYQDLFNKKFAELIVRQCVDVIRKEVSLKYKDGGETEEFMGGHYASSVLARVKIKHHFGVEE